MPKNPYKLISPQAGRHSEVCEMERWLWLGLGESSQIAEAFSYSRLGESLDFS